MVWVSATIFRLIARVAERYFGFISGFSKGFVFRLHRRVFQAQFGFTAGFSSLAEVSEPGSGLLGLHHRVFKLCFGFIAGFEVQHRTLNPKASSLPPPLPKSKKDILLLLLSGVVLGSLYPKA